MPRTARQAFTWAVALLISSLIPNVASAQEENPYIGAPVTLGTAPNGAIANKKILDGISKVSWLEPTIEKPAEGVWVLGGYGIGAVSIIDTDEGLIAFDTGDSKHDGELVFGAIRTFSQKPVKAIIYGHSHTTLGAGVLAEGNKEVQIIGHPGLNAVVEKNLQGGGAPAYFPEIGRAGDDPVQCIHAKRGARCVGGALHYCHARIGISPCEYPCTGRAGNDGAGGEDVVLH